MSSFSLFGILKWFCKRIFNSVASLGVVVGLIFVTNICVIMQGMTDGVGESSMPVASFSDDMFAICVMLLISTLLCGMLFGWKWWYTVCIIYPLFLILLGWMFVIMKTRKKGFYNLVRVQ